MDVSIDTDELRKLAADLAAGAVKTEALSSAKLTEIRDDMGDYAQSIVPVKTGELKGSRQNFGGKDFRGVKFTARHAGFVENGTSDTAPQPYMWPASRRAERELYDEFKKLADPLA